MIDIRQTLDTQTTEPRGKRELQAEISRHVKEFLARGGKITKVGTGEHALDYAKTRAWREEFAARYNTIAEGGGPYGADED